MGCAKTQIIDSSSNLKANLTMTPQKICGLLLIVLGIPFGITALDGVLPMSYFVAVGLMMIFFGKERIDDERVQQLKMKALYTAMSMGLALTLLAYVLVRSYYQKLIPARSLHNVISAWDFLAGVLALSLGLFYFYRWQDARPGRDA
jgi:hypothetical protein